jgi:muramoyltetrapeptide carboxypeptidase
VSAIVPPPLRPGSTIAVIAPASPFPERELFAGLAWLGSRYRLVMQSSALRRTGYLAGDDARRADELAWAFERPDVEAIVCARGGYGITRALLASRARGRLVESGALARSPRWLVGFSDVTALHVELANAGVASIHGPNGTGLWRAAVREKAALIGLLEDRAERRVWSDLRVAVRGAATGALFGGNLALLEAMAAAGRLRVPDGAIVLLEDVTERPYRVDRMLTSLLLGGHLSRAGAIVVGEFDQCVPGPDGVTVEEVLEERLATLGVPLAFGAPFGHGQKNEPFAIGVPATLTVDGTLVLRGA